MIIYFIIHDVIKKFENDTETKNTFKQVLIIVPVEC